MKRVMLLCVVVWVVVVVRSGVVASWGPLVDVVVRIVVAVAVAVDVQWETTTQLMMATRFDFVILYFLMTSD